jgi:hypothetical protein
VEGEVVRDLLAPVRARRSGPHRIELTLERPNVALRLLRSLAGSKLLEHHAHRKDGQELLVVDRPDTGSAERLRLDEPQELEVAERLADRCLARSELACQPRLDEPLARLEVAAKDALE